MLRGKTRFVRGKEMGMASPHLWLQNSKIYFFCIFNRHICLTFKRF